MSTADKKLTKEEAKQNKAVVQRYRDRLQVLKQAQEYSSKDDIPRAVNSYLKYLDALAGYYQTTEDRLNPKLFENQNGAAEILLVSQVYWDLAKAFDRAPNLQKECKRCLDQFALFSLGFKFQFVNSEMLRKYLKKGSCYNPKVFQLTYDKIRVQSKKCYVATHAFGEYHHHTNTLRRFKTWMLKYNFGHIFVEFYYRTSPHFVAYLERHPIQAKLVNPLLKFPLSLFAKALKRIRI